MRLTLGEYLFQINATGYKTSFDGVRRLNFSGGEPRQIVVWASTRE
jgi:hypothetical protein